MFKWLLNKSLGMFGYDAVLSKRKRRQITSSSKSEDCELTEQQRKKMLTATRDLYRNYAVAAWAIRRHLDYVSSFNFQAKSASPALDAKLESLMYVWGKRQNCEVTQRHRFSRLIRMLECQRVTGGDCFVVKLADGRIQALESDRVQTVSGIPGGIKPEQLTHGVLLDDAGAAVGYVVCKREKGALKFERLIPAENVYHHTYAERFDQVRGISPLAAALNTFQDTYEGIDYALARLKVEQLLAVKLKRAPGTTPIGTANADGVQEVDFGSDQVQWLELEKDEDADFMESKNPSANSQQFIQVCIQIALKALDIPYSFYAENFTNYSGARQALLQYQQSADDKRKDNIELLDWITEWKVEQWTDDGEFADFTEEEIASISWEWIPAGVPWIDPLKEVTAQQKAIASRLTSRTRICRSQGVSFPDLVDEIAAEEAYMREKKVAISLDVEVQKIESESTAHQSTGEDDENAELDDDTDAEKAGEVVVK